MRLPDSNPSSSAWELPGPNNSPVRECDRALKRLHTCEARPPADDDRPPLSLLPMTAGARAALELDREKVRRGSAPVEGRTKAP